MHRTNSDQWLQKVIIDFQPEDYEIIRQAVLLAEMFGENSVTPIGKSCFEQGLAIADILFELRLDSATIAASLVYSCVQYAELTIDDAEEHLGIGVAKLVQGTGQMSGIGRLYQAVANNEHYSHNVDNIRKMILAMVDDIRVVLIKLAEHLYVLRSAKNLTQESQKQIARETMALYAPLTHRLGIAQIKWELEDLAFLYLEPEKYHEIAVALEARFPERNEYIKEVIAAMHAVLAKEHIHGCQITGRIKHVYSIYRKMTRKNVGLGEVYDVSAIRVFVSTIEDCYRVLSQIHEVWQYLPEEFDDYIAAPKANGYRSIHTAVYGPENRVVEIQIRTFDMHHEAELGIAAHWIYKEGKRQAVDYETKIAWLRQVIDWQQEVIKSEETLLKVQQMFNDRVYVFTPEGDILDLPKGATPIDFAYHLHSGLGHRCCGAKINGSIVPLNYVLKTGDRVEILSAKEERPSRDWLIASSGFLYTARARTKVFHWFKKQSQERNIELGRELLSREIHRLNISNKIDLVKAAQKLKFKNTDDMLAALGSNDLKFTSILNALGIDTEKLVEEKIAAEVVVPHAVKGSHVADVNIHGVGKLLTYIATCCKPIPGDAITGYITQGQGISIHRADCINALNAKKHHPERFIAVSWSGATEKCYGVNILISAFDRAGLVRDITNVLADDGVAVLGLDAATDRRDGTAKIKMTLEITGLNPLSRIISKINKISGIFEVMRQH